MPLTSCKFAVHADNNKHYKELCEKFRLNKFPNGDVVNWNYGNKKRNEKEYVHLYPCSNEDYYDVIADAFSHILATFKNGDYLIDNAVEELNNRLKSFFE